VNGQGVAGVSDCVPAKAPPALEAGLEEEEMGSVPVPIYTPPDWVLDGVPNRERDAMIAALVRALEHGFAHAGDPPTREEREARALAAAGGEQKRTRVWATMYGSGN
jgi:hypothetical protein